MWAVLSKMADKVASITKDDVKNALLAILHCWCGYACNELCEIPHIPRDTPNEANQDDHDGELETLPARPVDPAAAASAARSGVPASLFDADHIAWARAQKRPKRPRSPRGKLPSRRPPGVTLPPAPYLNPSSTGYKPLLEKLAREQ